MEYFLWFQKCLYIFSLSSLYICIMGRSITLQTDNIYRCIVTWLERKIFADKRIDKIASELRRENNEETRSSMKMSRDI